MAPQEVTTDLGRSVRIIPLSTEMTVSSFSCGRPSLDIFLHKFALYAPRQGLSQTWICLSDTDTILGFLTLAYSSFFAKNAPDRVAKGMPNFKIPALLLAQFAVDLRYQGQGIGAIMLEYVLRKALETGKITSTAPAVPVRALMVTALDAKAAAFYQKYGFEPSPSDPLHLFLLIKDIAKSLDGA